MSRQSPRRSLSAFLTIELEATRIEFLKATVARTHDGWDLDFDDPPKHGEKNTRHATLTNAIDYYDEYGMGD